MKLSVFMAEMVKIHNELMQLGYTDGEVMLYNQYGFPIFELWIESRLQDDKLVLKVDISNQKMNVS